VRALTRTDDNFVEHVHAGQIVLLLTGCSHFYVITALLVTRVTYRLVSVRTQSNTVFVTAQ
jgi:hypothetical protein